MEVKNPTMGQRIKKIKKIRIHREGVEQLVCGAIGIVAIATLLWYFLKQRFLSGVLLSSLVPSTALY
jgi:uncharacterized membrane protein